MNTRVRRLLDSDYELNGNFSKNKWLLFWVKLEILKYNVITWNTESAF